MSAKDSHVFTIKCVQQKQLGDIRTTSVKAKPLRLFYLFMLRCFQLFFKPINIRLFMLLSLSGCYLCAEQCWWCNTPKHTLFKLSVCLSFPLIAFLCFMVVHFSALSSLWHGRRFEHSGPRQSAHAQSQFRYFCSYN